MVSILTFNSLFIIGDYFDLFPQTFRDHIHSTYLDNILLPFGGFQAADSIEEAQRKIHGNESVRE